MNKLIAKWFGYESEYLEFSLATPWDISTASGSGKLVVRRKTASGVLFENSGESLLIDARHCKGLKKVQSSTSGTT